MAKTGLKSIKTIAGLGTGAFLVFAAIVSLVYQDDIYQSLLDPGTPYQTYEKPDAPDYAFQDSWISIPDLSTDPFETGGIADAFVVLPGMYMGGKEWNMPTDHSKLRKRLTDIARPNYADTFREVGRLFTPIYRQASHYSFMTNREDARAAQSLAYEDTKRAFEYFLAQSPKERPIVLAGFGQGGSHAIRLLDDFFDGPLKDRLAVAYIINHPLPLDMFEKIISGPKPCETETDTSCVIAFGAFFPGDKSIAQRFVTRLNVHNGIDYTTVDERPLLCTNPLLWNTSPDFAPKRLHKGGIAAKGLEPDAQAAPLSQQTGAQCQDGILLVDNPKSRSLRRPGGIGAKFKTLPSNLFYEDLRQNALKRVDALIATGELPTRVKKLDSLEVIDIIESPVVPVGEKEN